MITRVAVLPYPPLLVPELTVRSQPETERLRDACLRAVSSLTQASTRWVAVGADRRGTLQLGPDTVGTFAGYGVDVPVSLGQPASLGQPDQAAAPDPLLPLPALIAGWLRAQSGASEVTAHLLSPDTTPEECRSYGAALERAVRDEPAAMLVLADGTNRRDTRSPFPPDAQAEKVDDLLRSALARADLHELLQLDPVLLAALGVEGRAALQVMATAVASAGGSWSAELLYSDTPFGITYHVAVWTSRRS